MSSFGIVTLAVLRFAVLLSHEGRVSERYTETNDTDPAGLLQLQTPPGRGHDEEPLVIDDTYHALFAKRQVISAMTVDITEDTEQDVQAGALHSLLQSRRVDLDGRATQGTQRTFAHRSPVQLVNVLAGTNMNDFMSSGNVLPITARPWGFNHWAVQSISSHTDAFWFHPDDSTFAGLRCTHQASPWNGDYGRFLILPTFLEPSATSKWRPGDAFAQSFYQPATSVFKPYHFKTQVLKRNSEAQGAIQLELVPTMHGALVRTVYPEKHAGGVQFHLQDGSWQMDPKSNKTRVFGKTSSNPGRGVFGHKFAMYIVVEAPPGVEWDLTTHSAEAWLMIPTRNSKTTYDTRVSTSFISHEYAVRSLADEVGNKSMDALKREAQQDWDSLMSRVQVDFADESRNAVFYTNLYRSMLFPRNFSEVDSSGKLWHYSAYNDEVVEGPAVADQGFWDAYRTVYTMLSVIFPDKLGPIIAGWVNSYKEGKWLATWSAPAQRFSMVGTMGDCSLADAIVKHKQGLITGFDPLEAFDAIWHDATVNPDHETSQHMYGRPGLDTYMEKGFVPSDPSITRYTSGQDQSASLSLNYMLADASIAFAASALGAEVKADLVRNRSNRFDVLFDRDTKYFRAVDLSGSWKYPFEPQTWLQGFTEGNAAAYRFYVPHNVSGLVSLYGGQENFCNAMEETTAAKLNGSFFYPGGYGSVIHEMREAAALDIPLGLYFQGNQPVHHILYVASVAGCRSFAQRTLRQAMAETYTINGWSGDEDNGEMSAWYVLSALGIYSILPGSDDLVLGSPEVSSAVLRIPHPVVPGQIREIQIEAKDNSADAVYVNDVSFNGNLVVGSSVKYQDFMKDGASLNFRMSSSPNTAFTRF